MEAKIPSSHVMFRCGYLDPLHLFGRREWGRFFFFFVITLSPMLERAQLRKETAVYAMTIDQH